jgi:hypothetical protein
MPIMSPQGEIYAAASRLRRRRFGAVVRCVRVHSCLSSQGLGLASSSSSLQWPYVLVEARHAALPLVVVGASHGATFNCREGASAQAGALFVAARFAGPARMARGSDEPVTPAM